MIPLNVRILSLLAGILFLIFATGLSESAAEPVGSPSLYDQGMEAFHKKDYSAAVAWFNRAAAADPENARLHFYLGLAHNRLNHLTDATRSLEKAFALDPALPGLRLNLGIVYYKRNFYESALGELQVAVVEEPSNGTAFFFKGLTEHKLEEFNASIPSFQQARALTPEFEQSALYFEGIAHYHNEHLDSAREALNRSIAAGPETENAEKARQILARIEAGKPAKKDFNLSLGAGFLYDDNLTSFEQDLVANVDDIASTLELGLDYNLYRKHNWSVGVSYDFYQSLYAEEEDFDLTSHMVGFSTSKETEPWDFGFDVLGGHTMLGGESFLQNYSLIPSIGYAWSKQLYSRLHYHLQLKNFQQAAFDVRDGNNHAVGTDQFYFFLNGKARVRVGYRFMVENTEGGPFDYQAHNVGASLKFPVPLAGNLTLRYNYMDKNFTKITPAINQKREDDIQTAQATLTRPLAWGLALKLDYQYIESVSNLPVVDYTKNVLFLSVTFTY